MTKVCVIYPNVIIYKLDKSMSGNVDHILLHKNGSSEVGTVE